MENNTCFLVNYYCMTFCKSYKIKWKKGVDFYADIDELSDYAQSQNKKVETATNENRKSYK